MSHRFKIFAALCIGWCFATPVRVGLAEPAIRRDFNGPEKSWKLLTTAVPAKVLAQEHLAAGARDRSGIERVVVAAPAGQSAFLVCPIERLAVLDELQIRLWVNASRPDVQLAARVVLPRSLDPQRREPATAIIRGSKYNRAGNWQELVLADAPKLLAEQVRVMRATPGAAIDSHEAYVDGVVLVVPGDPNGMELGTDELSVDGVLLTTPSAGAPRLTTAASIAETPAQRVNIASRQNAVSAPGQAAAATTSAAVRLEGTTLLIDGKTFLPRVIQWNGEPLQFLSTCGFNVVHLPAAPTVEQSAEAERNGLWFLCPPERPDAITRAGLGRVGDRVLAWQLQDDALEVDPGYAMRWAELVRQHDAVFGRPVVVLPRANWAAVSKAADILIARHPRNGSLSALDFQAWLEACPQKAQPGTPMWIAVSTQMDDAVRSQVGALTRAAATPLSVDAQQVESCVELACAQGARGFVFESNSSLSEADERARRRAAIVQLINRRLQLIEPWLAGGKVVERVASTDGGRQAVLLHVDRARLLFPLRKETRLQVNTASEAMPPATKDIVFTVPGVPETSQVFYVSPASMRTLPSQRIAGGTKMTIPGGADGYVVMTEDPQVIQGLRQRFARDGAKVVQLKRELVARRALAVAASTQKLMPLGYDPEVAKRDAAAVNKQLANLDALLTSGKIEKAHEVATAVENQLAQTQSEQRGAVVGAARLESNPLALTLDTLPEFAAVQRALAAMQPGGNLLTGGDFEDLGEMTQLGWQHVEIPFAGVQTSAQLSAVEPQHGKYCLELKANAEDARLRRAAGSNLVWIVSPPVPIDPNQTVEITGWVRIDRPLAAGEGLEIVDSLGGPALSLFVGQTYGWQPFRLIRATGESSLLRITLSLAGIGSVKVDAVMVRTLGHPIAQRLPPATAPAVSTATNTASPIQRAGAPGLIAPPTR